MRNPTRRNRNIGTAKQGLGRDNRLTIPGSWRDRRAFYEKLRSPVRVRRAVFGKPIDFLVEPVREGFLHACTVDDICRMLELISREDLAPLDVVVLRQPTRKQEILSSVWGRLFFWYEAGRSSGVAIVLEALRPEGVMKWSRSLSPDDQA